MKPSRSHRASTPRTCALLALACLLGATTLNAQIQTSVPSMTGFIQTNSIPCTPQSYLVSGSNISADVVVAPPAAFKISVDSLNWVSYPGSITISQNGPTTIPTTKVWVKLDTTVLGTYSGNIVHSSTDAASVFVAIDGTRSAKSPTTTDLTSNLNPSIFGQSVTLTAAVTSPLPGTPTGTVSFFDGVTLLSTVALNVSGSATLSTSALTFGTHSLTATYNSDSKFDASTSVIVSQFVRGTTTTIVASNNNPSVSGQSVTLTATVTSGFTGTPTGSVTFFDGISSLGSAALASGSGTLSTSALTPGSHSITATYDGDVSFAASTSPVLTQMVKGITTTTLASNHNPSVSGQTVTFTATVGSITPGTITGTVTFFDGLSPVGPPVTMTGSAATYSTAYTVAGGSHSITATYNGDANYAGSTSSAVLQTINKSPTTAVVTANYNPSYVGQTVTFTATVSALAPGSGTPTGSVTFSVDGTPTGPISMSGGTASMSTSSLGLGIHAVSASYGGDGEFNPITSSSYADSVDPIITATADLHGSISPSGLVLAPYGGNQIFVITPAIGYAVDSLFIDGVATAGAERDTFFNVTANHTIHATFILHSHIVTVNSGPNGTATPLGPVVVPRGDSLVVTFTGAAHYHVADILLDGVSVGAAPSYTLHDVQADHTLDVSFTIDTYVITAAAGPNGAITPSGSVIVPYNSSQSFSFTPSPHYAVDSIAVDGAPTDSVSGYTFTSVSAAHTITAYFGLSPAYEATYRTFMYDSLMVKKAIPKKPVTQYWEFTLQNNLGVDVTEVNVVFANDVKELISVGESFTGSGLKKAWRFTGNVLHPLDHLVITGRSTKAKPQSIAKLFMGPVTRIPTAKAILPDRQWAELPMPNAASVRDLAFIQAGLASSPMIVGVAKTSPDSSKFYGWVSLKKSADMYKSLIDRGTPHTAIGKGFDLLSGRTFLKGQTSLSPVKHNDRTFADLLTLKFNILLSKLGITTPGLGELKLAAPASPWDGMLLRDVAAAGDSMMTCYKTFADRSSLYASLDSLLRGLNAAFSAPLDTNSWSDSLRLKGAARLEDIAYLSPSGIAPVMLTPAAGSELLASDEVPDRIRLAQNYPNPFNPSTTIEFFLPENASVTLKVYNMLGQEIATLADRFQAESGVNEFTFDAGAMASGVYYYRLEVQGTPGMPPQSLVKKMVLIK